MLAENGNWIGRDHVDRGVDIEFRDELRVAGAGDEPQGKVGGLPKLEGVEDFGNWIGLCCEGVPVLSVNVFPGGGGPPLPSLSPVLPPFDEGNPVVGLPVDNGNGAGRDLMERGCNVDVEFRDELRVMGVGGGLSLPSLLPVLPLVEGGNPPAGSAADKGNGAGRDLIEKGCNVDVEFRDELRVMGVGGGLSLPTLLLVLPLVDEGNLLVDLPVDNGIGVGRDLIEKGCNVDVEFRDELRVVGVVGGPSLPSPLPVLPLVDEGNPPVCLAADKGNGAGRDSVGNDGNLGVGLRELRVMGVRDG